MEGVLTLHAGPHAAFWTVAFSVFILGLRHGADPDHLAAIDNLTRNSLGARGRLAGFVGTLFAGGHSVMVLSIATLSGLLGSRLAAHRDALETAGTWVGILTLLAIGTLNLRQLVSKRPDGLIALKFAALPRRLRDASSPLVAIPIGLLFGLGFDTSSQIAAYTLAFANGGSLLFGALVGLTFSAGMAVTDTLDSLLVHRMCTRRPFEILRATRAWIVAVTALAFIVGTYELAQTLGWRSPVNDLALSGFVAVALLGVFAWTLVTIRETTASRLAPANKPQTGDAPLG